MRWLYMEEDDAQKHKCTALNLILKTRVVANIDDCTEKKRGDKEREREREREVERVREN